MRSITAVAALALVSVVSARQLNVINQCPYTIWPGAYGNGLTNDQTGFQLAPGASRVLNVPDNLNAFRIWPRTACSGSGSTLNCESGDCGGRFQCSGITGQPATLIEMTLGSQDYYDLSNVDGFSVPMGITPTGSYTNPNPNSIYSCASAECSMDPNTCVPELVKRHSDGTVTCLSICSAINDADQRAAFPILQGFYNDVNTAALLCCSCGPNCGAGCGCYTSSNCLYGCSPYATAGMGGVCDVTKWPLSSQGRQYNTYLKYPCPNSYSWPFDDNTSTEICVGANYDITFCPSGGTAIDTSKTYTIRVAGGRSGCSTYLSVASCGSNLVDLYNVDDGSGRQRFQFVPVPGKTNTYNILVPGGRSGCNAYLSTADCSSNLVDLYNHDDGSGRQEWILTPAGNGYNIKISGGRSGCGGFLSSASCGSNLVDMYSFDDESGRQEWILTPV